MASRMRLAGIAAAIGALGACTAPDFALGESVKYDMAVQTVDPDPVCDDPTCAQPGDHGEKGAAAVKRYRTDAVKEVETQTTTTQSGGGSGPR